MKQPADLPETLAELGLADSAPALVVIGGAAGLVRSPELSDALLKGVIPAVVGAGAVVLDGGTDSGIMALMGEARTSAEGQFPLVGVAARGTVTLGNSLDRDGAEMPAPGHSHLLLVPGNEWGDESAWLSAAAAVVAGTRPSATVLANGGSISRHDVLLSVTARRPVVVLEGTGRLADELADSSRIAPDVLVTVLPVNQPDAVRKAIAALLEGDQR